MFDKWFSKIYEEIKKIRNDMDAIKAYSLSIAEQITIIATNTAPADSDDTEPAADDT